MQEQKSHETCERRNDHPKSGYVTSDGFQSCWKISKGVGSDQDDENTQTTMKMDHNFSCRCSYKFLIRDLFDFVRKPI